ncbi:MAG: alpha/beta-type small acid-soluble spore protein [Firmicutes bacterium]|nr:alpha/beta-type small acid-soluble spore protein [Bacillota bacterium]
MAAGQKRNTLVYAQAKKALDQMKYEISKELNIDTSPIQGDYWGYMTARDCGAVGGHMVKRMIEAAERTLSQQAVANVQAGFRAGLASQQASNNQNVTNPNLNLNTIDQYY